MNSPKKLSAHQYFKFQKIMIEDGVRHLALYLAKHSRFPQFRGSLHSIYCKDHPNLEQLLYPNPKQYIFRGVLPHLSYKDFSNSIFEQFDLSII